MAQFISVTDVHDLELNINVDHIIVFYKNVGVSSGATIIKTSSVSYHVNEDVDRIITLIEAS